MTVIIKNNRGTTDKFFGVHKIQEDQYYISLFQHTEPRVIPKYCIDTMEISFSDIKTR